MRRTRFLVPTAAVGLSLAVTILMPGSATASTIRVYNVAHAASVSANTREWGNSNPNKWKLVFQDQFTKALNTRTAWSVYNHNGSSNTGTAAYSARHVTVSGGQLHIRGYVDRKVASDGRVVTGGLGLWERPQRYGKYRMLVQMNACTDVKYAWMLWPYDNVWPAHGEIDFAEDEGGNRHVTTGSLNYANSRGQFATAQSAARPQKPLSGWHVIGVEWTPTSVIYTMDGQRWGAVRTKHLPPTRMVFVMQTEGMARPGHVDLKGQCNANIGWVQQYAYVGKR